MFIVIWNVTDPDWIQRFETEEEMHEKCMKRMSVDDLGPEDAEYLKWRETHTPPPIAVFEGDDPWTSQGLAIWKNVRPFAIYFDEQRWDCIPSVSNSK